jgi:hypothetical protein
MTLVVAVNGPESIWLLADRRLSSRGRPVRDDARKVMILETNDGQAILGYAGLGKTPGGTEPADFMSAVLRGRNLPLEKSLSVLADALKKEFPRHMRRLVDTHNVFIPAFLGREPRLYSIDIVLSPDRRRYEFRYVRHVVERPTLAVPTTARIGVAGSGGIYLSNRREWQRSLLRVIRANDRGKISALAVADHLASLNNEVSLAIKSVGPRCIVAWRYRKGGGAQNGGGGHQFYTGTRRDEISPALPIIAGGWNIEYFSRVVMSHFRRTGDIHVMSDPEAFHEIADEHKPDETLR